MDGELGSQVTQSLRAIRTPNAPEIWVHLRLRGWDFAQL